MTTQELDMLAQGRIPAAPILRLIAEYLDSESNARLTGQRDLQHLAHLGEKTGIPYETLVTWVEKPDRASDYIPFPVADRIVCATGRVDIWRGELIEYYTSVDMNWVQCACPGCTKYFHQGHYQPAACKIEGCTNHPKARGLCNAHYIQARNNGTLEQHPREYLAETRRIYCSQACKYSAWQQRQGITKARRKSYLKNRDVKCRNGHPRTPENTKVRANGKRECAVCHREAARKGYQRAKARMAQAAAA